MIIVPKPVTNSIKIDVENVFSNYEIYNMTGELILFGKLQEQLIISSSLPGGIYRLILWSEGNFSSGNFVKL